METTPKESPDKTAHHIANGRATIATEIAELQRLHDRVGPEFGSAVEALEKTLAAGRKLVVVGIGKSGNIGHKLAATLNSTGSTTVVLHAQNALHGDLGILSAGDAVIALSQSGETHEVLDLLPHIRRLAGTLVAFTGNASSSLSHHSDITLDTHVSREACPLGLAPTSSTTVMLALGDALAMALLEARGFREADFAQLHPGGSLGRALLTTVADVMRTGSALATVSPDTTVGKALTTMGKARAGAAIVVSPENCLLGIFTQGDFTRAFQGTDSATLADRPVSELMTEKPVSISADKLGAELLRTLEEKRVDDLVVVDTQGRVVGIVDTQDLSRAKIL